MAKYKIETGVPVPETRSEYPWAEMRPGQSVVVPKSAGSSARGFVAKMRPGWKVTERKVDADSIRVWFELDELVEDNDDLDDLDELGSGGADDALVE